MSKRIALVIGISKYHDVKPLINPTNDANDISDILEELNFEVKKCIDINHIQMVTELTSFLKNIHDYDVSLLYFAGHGMQINGENYLAPIDINLNSEKETILTSYNMNNYLKSLEIHSDKTNIIILDSCRNNPFTSHLRGTVINGFASFTNAPKGTFISFSTSPDKLASDGEGSNGLYTGLLKHYLKYPNIKIEDTFKLVRTKMAELSANEQISWEHSSLIGDFYFRVEEFPNKAVSQEEIYNYIEDQASVYLQDSSYSIYDHECLPIVDAFKKYGLPVIEIMRLYSRESYRRIDAKFSDNDIDEININYLTSWGFAQKNYRWYYNEEYVIMGDPLPLDEDLKEKKPINDQEVNVTFEATGVTIDGKVYFEIVANLPDEMYVMFTLSSKDNKYRAQSKGTMKNGKVKTDGFTNKGNKIENGLYMLYVTTPIYSVQPDIVKKRLGKDNRNLNGQYVKHTPFGGKTANCNLTVIVKDDEITVY